MGTAGTPAGAPNNFSIEQNGVPADIAANSFLTPLSFSCSRTVNRCYGVHKASKSIIVFGHDGAVYYEKRLNTGDSFNYFTIGSDTQGIFSNFAGSVKMITYNPGTNILTAGPLIAITGVEYACQPESGAYSLLAITNAGKFVRKTTTSSFTTVSQF